MYKKFFKRFLDIVISLLALIVLSPVMLVVAILVRIKLGSPVIFKQERPGKDEKIFKLYKFRSMSDKKDENGKLLSDEERLTKFGKILRATSLDELPELVNILKGDMSFIGPRPLLIKYIPFYTIEERKRHTVRPGLTGLAQISGRNSVDWDERFKYDIEYVNTMSLKKDISIFFKTIKKVIVRENVLSGNKQFLLSLHEARKDCFDIRKLEYEDIVFFEKYLKQYIKELRENYYTGDIEEEVIRIYNNMLEFAKNGTAYIIGLFVQDYLRGFLWSYKNEENRHINYFYIDKICRSYGYGSKMLNRLLEESNEDIELLVDKENEKGKNFYLKNSFQIIDEDNKSYKMLKKM